MANLTDTTKQIAEVSAKIAKQPALRWRNNAKSCSSRLYVGCVDVGVVFSGGLDTWSWAAHATVPPCVPCTPIMVGCESQQDAERGLAGYVARHLFGDGEHILCQGCGYGFKNDRFLLVDTVMSESGSQTRYPVYAGVSFIDPDGTVTPNGDTHINNAPDPDYDTQEAKKNKHGYYKLLCNCCGNQWFEPRIHFGHENGTEATADQG